jgi:mRNA interferase HigB
MNVVAFRTLKEFWERHSHAETPLRTWYGIVSKAEWKGPADVKAMFGTSVDFVGDNRVIFDIGGNKYRLVVRVSYLFKQVMVKFVGTHDEYDKINPETV